MGKLTKTVKRKRLQPIDSDSLDMGEYNVTMETNRNHNHKGLLGPSQDTRSCDSTNRKKDAQMILERHAWSLHILIKPALVADKQ